MKLNFFIFFMGLFHCMFALQGHSGTKTEVFDKKIEELDFNYTAPTSNGTKHIYPYLIYLEYSLPHNLTTQEILKNFPEHIFPHLNNTARLEEEFDKLDPLTQKIALSLEQCDKEDDEINLHSKDDLNSLIMRENLGTTYGPDALDLKQFADDYVEAIKKLQSKYQKSISPTSTTEAKVDLDTNSEPDAHNSDIDNKRKEDRKLVLYFNNSKKPILIGITFFSVLFAIAYFFKKPRTAPLPRS